ncbi:MAG: chemotaxis protein CheA [Anaerolineae bacterium]|nr:chemotaxis protein CheA [Anaerolineae bacterium]
MSALNDGPGINVNTPQDAFLRVKAEKVSQLLDLVGELGLAAVEVTRHPALEKLELEGFEMAVHRLELLIREVQDLASSLRLVPVNEIFKRAQRAVRDLSQQTGKPIDLTLEGGETEIDKLLVDQLHDPLVHLVRNAADHGLESPQERRAAGKSERGRITLRATQQGSEIHLAISDDGRGLNRDRILAKARQLGLVETGAEPDDRTVWNYVFHSGLSTAQEVSNLSGRGVGMDVVRAAIQALRGRIEIDSTPGQGTCINLRIPLTLAFLESLVVRSENRLYAIPIDVVGEVFKPEAEQVTQASAEHSELVRLRGELVPVYRLQQLYEDSREKHSLTNQIVVAVQTSQGLLGLPVDEIIGQQQVTMKPLNGQLKDIRAGAGYALLSSGDVSIALDCERLIQDLSKN